MKKKKKSPTQRALDKINRKSAEFGRIPDFKDESEDEFSSHSEDATHSNRQTGKNLGEY